MKQYIVIENWNTEEIVQAVFNDEPSALDFVHSGPPSKKDGLPAKVLYIKEVDV